MRRISIATALLLMVSFWAIDSLAFASASGAHIAALHQSTTDPTPPPTDQVVVSRGNHGGRHNVSVKRKHTKVGSENADPSTDAARPHPDFPVSLVVLAPWPSADSADCAEQGLGVINPATNIRPRVCAKKWVCGAERIDDLVSGDVAGEDASGRYAQLLTGVIGLVSSVSNNQLPDVNSLSDFLLTRGLASEHGDDQIPEFFWCGKKARGSGDVTVEIVPVDPTKSPRFGWTTTIGDEYNIPGLRADSLLALQTVLGLNEPELAAVPPIDNGFTWVKWPTWLWVDGDTSPFEVWDENDAGTVRMDMRAVVDRVEWTFDGTPMRVCTLDQMLAYDEQTHDPVADAPECVYRFNQAISGDLEATVFYNIEERIRSRVANKNAEYADSAWVPTAGVGQLPLSTVISDYGVREIYSVNTPVNMTDEEIADLLRNE